MVRKHPRAAILTLLAVVLGTFGSVASVSAASPTLRIEPAAQTVANGATFTVKVVQNADVATSGTQASVTFDQSKVKITSVTRGTPHASAPIFVPADMPGAIATANASGKLETVATAFLPPASVAAGDAEFLIVVFTASACGESPLGLPVSANNKDAVILDGRDDTYGNTLAVTATGGKVTVDCGAAATATPPPAAATPAPTSAGATPKPTAKPTAKPTSDPTASPSGAVEGTTGTAPPTDTLPVQTASMTDPRSLVLSLAALIAIAAALIAGALLVTGPKPDRRRR